MFTRVGFALASLIVTALLYVPTTASATIHDVQMISLSFSPANVVIAAGDEVRWTNASGFTHTTTSGTICAPDGLWDSGALFPNDEFTFQFNTPGVYDYFCIPHCSCCVMVGTVTVTGCAIDCPQGDGEVVASASTGSKTMDLDGDGDVSIVDVSLFASGYPPQPEDLCIDFDCDGVITIVDLSLFAAHLFHVGAIVGPCN